MIEVDEDDTQWAEAAVSPSSSDVEGSGSGEEANDEDSGRRSPFSAMHLGATPSPPPPSTTVAAAAATGEMTSPPQLTTAMMSPIEKTQERFNDEFE